MLSAMFRAGGMSPQIRDNHTPQSGADGWHLCGWGQNGAKLSEQVLWGSHSVILYRSDQ